LCEASLLAMRLYVQVEEDLVGLFVGESVEQVEDEVAPVAAECVPAKAKASDEEYGYVDLTSSI
jgi:hypothetical protein